MDAPLQSSSSSSSPPRRHALAGPETGSRHGASTPAAEGRTQFYGCQVGGKSIINYSYTDDPWKLLLWDLRNFLKYLWAVPNIVLPATNWDGGNFDELYPSPGNLLSIAIHSVLVVLQLLFLLALPLAFLFPVYPVALGVGVFFLVNYLLCLLLNGTSLTYDSEPDYVTAQNKDKFPNEKWVFLNGVAVGETWMMSNINRLSLTFQRPVQGIHNKTEGIIFDVLECLVQRTFNYATRDVREAYRVIKEHLYRRDLKKVVFIVHSQGGIQGSLVLDWLLQELPQDLLAKLEVYSFGCAANHFNNPHRRLGSQTAELRNPNGTLTTAASPSMTTFTESPVESTTTLDIQRPSTPTSPRGAPPTPPLGPDARSGPGPVIVAAADRVIGHVEHYAHTTDFVALWGVLNFVRGERASPAVPRFTGRVFARDGPAAGHQFSQHYLNAMFPLERDPATGRRLGRCRDANPFMDSVVEERGCQQPVHVHAAADADEHEGFGLGLRIGGDDENGGTQGGWREGIERSLASLYMDINGRVAPEAAREVEVHGSFHEDVRERMQAGTVRVRDLSRLWQYRNGRVPPELPTGLVRGADGVAKARTL